MPVIRNALSLRNAPHLANRQPDSGVSNTLIERIDQYLVRAEISEATFCRRAKVHRMFVANLRSGSSPRRDSIDRVESFMRWGGSK